MRRRIPLWVREELRNGRQYITDYDRPRRKCGANMPRIWRVVQIMHLPGNETEVLVQPPYGAPVWIEV